MQAIILAAGMGKRLKELTSNATKCMVEVNGVTMAERVLRQLDDQKLNRIIMVVGYEAQKLMDYVKSLHINTPVEFINNTIYDKTNNIYSLYMAKDALLKDDTILLESDLILGDDIIEKLIKNPNPSLAVVAKYESWMDGTVVKIDEDDSILKFISKNEFKFEDIKNYYKTVNIYKFSKNFSQTHYVPFLKAYCKALGNNEYYEQVLKVISTLNHVEIKAMRLGDEPWYEIDDIQDLDIAESIFAKDEDKLQKINSRYGGYWRYPKLKDFCYLVNPYYPNQKLLDEIKANLDIIIREYPSGQMVNSLLAAKYFGIHKEQVCVGNGAAELIKSLMENLQGKIGMIYPTFEEYPHRKTETDIVPMMVENPDYSYSADDIMNFYEDKNIDQLMLINPDNPSGNYISKTDVLRIAKWAKEKNIVFIVDESFVDFADTKESETLLDSDVLSANDHLIVVKSISKSYGIPGLRLGVIASNNLDLIGKIKKDVAIWNINSFGEFYLQIFEKYRSEYNKAIEHFLAVRKQFYEELKKIDNLRVIPSQANYFMCEVTGKLTSLELVKRLLIGHNILIKDCSNKTGVLKDRYIRVAIKTEEENDELLEALRVELKK